MVGVTGELKPFRITKIEFIELIELISRKSEIDDIHAVVERFSIKSGMEEFKSFLRDLRIPSTIFNISIWMWGKPTIHFVCSKDYASYDISKADTLDQAVLIEQVIQSFFKKHSVSKIFSSNWIWLGAPLIFIASFAELALSISSLLGILRSQLFYPSLHLFIGLLGLTLVSFMFWSYKTSNPPHYSFVHSIIYMNGKGGSNVLISLVFMIIVEFFVSIISELTT